jgi:cytochrome c biogenesis protein ResB
MLDKMLLTKSKKTRVRQLTREAFIAGRREGLTQKEIEARAETAIRAEYGSGILATILIGVMINLAVSLISSWIKKWWNSDNPPETYQNGEPGYPG